jgi:hypothetical protein
LLNNKSQSARTLRESASLKRLVAVLRPALYRQ